MGEKRSKAGESKKVERLGKGGEMRWERRGEMREESWGESESERGEKDLRKDKGAVKPYRDLWNTIEMRKQ
jgi:hypothetical protein